MRQEPAVEIPTGKTWRRPREEWVETYRRIVAFFEARTDYDDFEDGGAYPVEDDPYVLHATHRAPAHADDEKDRPWHVLWNPWPGPGRAREAWIVDGRPLRQSETAIGESDITAKDRDIVEVFPGRVVICLALTQVAGIHAGEATWILSDERIERQFVDEVLPALEAEGEVTRRV